MYPKTLLNIVLVEPEIPQNTGNIGRTCVGAWSKLHLVEPLGFEINDKQLRRAGLDYWPHLELVRHPSWDDWWAQVPDTNRVFFFSTKAQNNLYDLKLQEGDWLVFGKETKGLDESCLQRFPDQCVRVPFPGKIRSFNLANAVAMGLSEGLRQLRGSY